MLKNLFISVYPDFQIELSEPSINSEKYQNIFNSMTPKIEMLQLENNQRVPFDIDDNIKLYILR